MVEPQRLSKELKNKKVFSINFGKSEFQSGNVSTIYGAPKVGKTSICFYLMSHLINKKEILYMDTENKIDNYSAIKGYGNLKNLFVLRINGFNEFETTINKLEGIIEKDSINVLIIDSLSYPFIPLASRTIWKQITEIYRKLKELTCKYNLITVIVTHLSRDPKTGAEVPKGGYIIGHISDKKFKISQDGMTKFSYLAETDEKKTRFIIELDGTIKKID